MKYLEYQIALEVGRLEWTALVHSTSLLIQTPVIVSQRACCVLDKCSWKNVNLLNTTLCVLYHPTITVPSIKTALIENPQLCEYSIQYPIGS